LNPPHANWQGFANADKLIWLSTTDDFRVAPASTGDVDNRPEVKKIFMKLRVALPELEVLLHECTSHWGYEDSIYRFYHQSFKVYQLQSRTLAIVNKLQALAPDRTLNQWFMRIIGEGTGKIFTARDNENWPGVTRPILEAFFHARYFLEMAVKYGRDLEHPTRRMPSGWGAFLYLYNLR
jgi:hypothetical protein